MDEKQPVNPLYSSDDNSSYLDNLAEMDFEELRSDLYASLGQSLNTEEQSETPARPVQEFSTKEFEERRGGGCLSAFGVIALALGLSVLIRVFVGEPYYVPSGSMLETIQIGDRLFGEKLSYNFRSPEAGEIVTFADPDGSDTILIKRVIATAGQTIDFSGGRVIVDGVALDEPYTNGKPSEPFTSTASFLEDALIYPYTIPDGCIWVMGDNRTNSQDSRYFGPVRVDTVTARGIFIFWPPEDIGMLE